MKNFVGPLVSLLFLGLLAFLMRGQIPEIVSILQNGNHALFFIATLTFFIGAVLMALRLRMIFSAKEIKVSFRQALDLTFISYFFNNFLPTSVGGDIVKAMCAARITKKPVDSITVVMMDRIFGLFMFIVIPCIGLFFLRDRLNPKVPMIIYSFLAGSIAFFFFIFNPSVAKRFHRIENFLNRFKIGSKIRQIYDGLHDFKNHKGTAVWAMVLSLLGQSVSIFVLYLFAVAMNTDPSVWPYFFLLVPVVHLISMLPPTLGGLGVREGLYVYFLKDRIGAERAFAIGILWLGLLLLFSVIGGIIYLIRTEYHVKFNKSTQEASA